MDRSLIATIYHGNDLEELISGRNILLPERPGGEKSTVARRPGAKRFGANRPGCKMILAEEMIWGEKTRILDGKIVTCFTHYKVNVRQTL